MSCFYYVCAHPCVTRHHNLYTFKAHDPFFFICSQPGDMKRNKKCLQPSQKILEQEKTGGWSVSARESTGLKDNLSFCFSFRLLPMDCKRGYLCPPSVRSNPQVENMAMTMVLSVMPSALHNRRAGERCCPKQSHPAGRVCTLLPLAPGAYHGPVLTHYLGLECGHCVINIR